MSLESTSSGLVQTVSLLGAAVVMVPIFRRFGLGSVLGYLMAGLMLRPLGLLADSQSIMHIAELGVVMFLFIIGLEMRPSHLWNLRRDIFGVGSLQIVVCSFMLSLLGLAYGYSLSISFIGAMGFVLTSTAIVMQVLNERGDIALPRGQKIVSILLFEDLLIVPLLALVAFMSPNFVAPTGGTMWQTMGIALGAIALVIAAGKWLLNPLFKLLALAKAREVMTAAALLVVLGTALLMQAAGLSMAMGAFLAGVLLAESSFRHQIEADIEPFRGILLGLFFISVGMSLDIFVVAQNWMLIGSAVIAMMIIKALCIYVVARTLKTSHSDSFDRMILMAQGGEFAFVLFNAAAAAGIITLEINANLTAIVVLSMMITPLTVYLFRKCAPIVGTSFEHVEAADGLSGSVLMIGFGRFGQVLSQLLLLRNVDVTIIDSDPEMVESAYKFGFKIYYGDGSRLDVLRASGAGTARAIAVCIDDKAMASKIVELVKSEFPHAKILVRAYDRIHARELVKAGVDFHVRETFESALKFGEATLRELGLADAEVEEISAEIRQRDNDRLTLELTEGAQAGRALMLGNINKPAPLVKPQRQGKTIGSVVPTATEPQV